MTCPTCEALGITCLRCQHSRYADRHDEGGADVIWTVNGPRCAFCARTMVRWGMGWVCGCGQTIDKDGELWTI